MPSTEVSSTGAQGQESQPNRALQLAKSLELMNEALAIFDHLNLPGIAARASMAIDVAQLELDSLQNGSDSSAA